MNPDRATTRRFALGIRDRRLERKERERHHHRKKNPVFLNILSTSHPHPIHPIQPTPYPKSRLKQGSKAARQQGSIGKASNAMQGKARQGNARELRNGKQKKHERSAGESE